MAQGVIEVVTTIGNADAVDGVVAQLNTLCRAASLEFALAVGRLVITTFYRGDIAAFRQRDVKKSASLRKLAQHPDLPMSAGALYRSVAIYEMSERLGIRAWKHVRASHLRLVLPLPVEDQSRLLQAAEENRWTVRALDREVAAILPKRVSIERGGRRRQSRLRRIVGSVERCVAALDAVVTDCDDVIDPLPEHVDELARALGSATRLCERLHHRVARALPGARTTPPPATAEGPVCPAFPLLAKGH